VTLLRRGLLLFPVIHVWVLLVNLYSRQIVIGLFRRATDNVILCMRSCLQSVPFLMKLDLCWGSATSNHNTGMGTAFSRSFQLQLGSGTRRLYPELFSAVQCCHVLPVGRCKSGLNKLTRLQEILGNTCDFGSVPRNPTETRREAHKYSRPNPYSPSCCIALFWLSFAQASQEEESTIVSDLLGRAALASKCLV
jgi:hypothetical protein